MLFTFCEQLCKHVMLELDAPVLTVFATLWSSNLQFSMAGLKLTYSWFREFEGWFRVYLELVEGLFRVDLGVT